MNRLQERWSWKGKWNRAQSRQTVMMAKTMAFGGAMIWLYETTSSPYMHLSWKWRQRVSSRNMGICLQIPEDHSLNNCCHENLNTWTLTYVCIVWTWNSHIRFYMFWILLLYYFAESLVSLIFLNWLYCHWTLAEQLTLLLHIQEVVGSDLCLETGCLAWSFSLFSSGPPANAGIVHAVSPRQLPSTSWLNHNSLIIIIIWCYIIQTVGSVIK